MLTSQQIADLAPWHSYGDLRAMLLPNRNIELQWITVLPDGMPKILARIILTTDGAKIVVGEINKLLAIENPSADKPTDS